jgi:hypothetical protein
MSNANVVPLFNDDDLPPANSRALSRRRPAKLAVISYRCAPERERVLEEIAGRADMTISQLEHRLSDIGLEYLHDLRRLPAARALEIYLREVCSRIVDEMVMAQGGRRKCA